MPIIHFVFMQTKAFCRRTTNSNYPGADEQQGFGQLKSGTGICQRQ